MSSWIERYESWHRVNGVELALGAPAEDAEIVAAEQRMGIAPKKATSKKPAPKKR